MASEAMEFDMDESEILFGSNTGDSDSGSDDDDDRDGMEGDSTAPRTRRDKSTTDEPETNQSERTTTPHLPRVESWAVDNMTSSRTAMMKQHKWKRQSHSMPAPSSGLLLAKAHHRRWNNQLDFDQSDIDGAPLSMDHPESIPIPSSSSYDNGGIPILSSAPLHWRRKSIEDSDDAHFIPPHQMVERDCFSLGMGHYFKHKPGNI